MRNLLLPAVLTLALAGCQPAETPFDLLIVNGTVHDGSLNPGRVANIGIRDGHIVSIDAAADAPAKRVIDAAGLVVTPGFIDPHTHARDDLLEPSTARNENYLAQGATTVYIGNDGDGLPNRVESIASMTDHGIGTNVAFFSGHRPVREAVMGEENRAPSEAELASMRELVAEDMQAGAIGLSTGLFYTPGSFAGTEEVIALAAEAARFGGIYDSHLRDESSYNIGVVGSVAELIEIGEKAGIKVHAAHLKALGRDVWGQSGDIIALIDSARERGLDVTADQYPYVASGTRLKSALIPAWVRADSSEAMFERLDNPDLADGIREEMEANLYRRGGRDSFLITGDSPWRGKTLGQVAEELGLDPIDAAIEIVKSGDPGVASFNMNVDDIDAMAIQPWMMTGSDGSEGHPRKFATYPKAYRDFVVERKLMPLEQFVHRSSGLVADTYGLCDRGYIAVGRRADVAVIDLEAFRPVADFENPTALATGVRHLLVNGRLAIADGQATAERAGEIIHFQNLECKQ